MTNQQKFEPGDRVRVVRGAWASDCATVETVLKDAVRVRLDTRGYLVVVRLSDLELIG